jgi:hypothetical protein
LDGAVKFLLPLLLMLLCLSGCMPQVCAFQAPGLDLGDKPQPQGTMIVSAPAGTHMALCIY